MLDAIPQVPASHRLSSLRGSFQLLLTAAVACALFLLVSIFAAQAQAAKLRAHRAAAHSSKCLTARTHAARVRNHCISRSPRGHGGSKGGGSTGSSNPVGGGTGTSGSGSSGSGSAPTEVPVSGGGSTSGSGSGSKPVEGEVTIPSPVIPNTGTVFGLASNSDPINQAPRAATVGAKLIRVEFEIATPVSQIESTIAALAANGEKALLLAGFAGRTPSAAEAQNLATWAHAFGPGGTFWANRSDGQLAVQQIEFGNETNQSYQFNGCSWNCSSYIPRAESYALALKAAQIAIDSPAGNTGVGMLAIGDDGGTGSENWLNGMFQAVPDLSSRIIGWTAHAYGPKPNWQPMFDHMIEWTRAHGAPTTLPIYVTEFGFASDNGSCLSNNYGWNPCMTYSQAAEYLTSDVAEFISTYGSKIAALMLYEVSDLAPSGANHEREPYFGVFQSNGSPKGAFTEAVRSLMQHYPAVPAASVKLSTAHAASATRAVAASVRTRAKVAKKAHHRRAARRHHHSRASSRAARSRAARH